MKSVEVAVASDMVLVELTRSGNMDAYGELWRRHSSALLVAVRCFTGFDPDDVVQETFLRVLQQLQEGRGPETAFRAYAIMAARNVARNMARDRSGDEITGVEDYVFDTQAPPEPDSGDAVLKSAFTQQVFSSLPTRWQEALWYREVEGLQVQELCAYLGMSENTASVLLKRAREGFKQAWIAANLEPASGLSPDCRWVVEKLPQFARGKASARTERKLASHFESCTRCSILSSEAEKLHERLAMVLLPVLFGGSAFTGYAAWLQSGASSAAAVTVAQGSAHTVQMGVGGGLAKGAVVPLAVLSAGALAVSIAFSVPPGSSVPPSTHAEDAPAMPSAASGNESDTKDSHVADTDDHDTTAGTDDAVVETVDSNEENQVDDTKDTANETEPETDKASDDNTDKPTEEPPNAPNNLTATPADGVEVGVYPRLIGVAAPHATVNLTMINQNGQTAEHTVTADAQGRWVYTPTQLMGQVTITGYQEYSFSGEPRKDSVVSLGVHEVGYGLDIQVDATGPQQTTIRLSGLAAPTKNQVVNIESTTHGTLAKHFPATAPGEVVITVPYARSTLGDLRFWQGDTSEGPRRTWWRTLQE
ncbi:sigma-70 family RNA polymerase sigma factor [Leucobacter massiliensis]|uniref:sigma-70 family RNA polymerase sigma factor n=1 Tax=Leucobacter massiliensis TaxID=1686285 RepID=UPI0015E35C75|nr:sigma-70 family RNA polymerase sigma factor [Leucobacter massiliensis]